MLRCALGTGWWIEIKMRLGSWEVNATTMEALLLWSVASPRVRRLRRSYAAMPPRTFSVKSMAELWEVREKGWECTIWFVWGSWFPGTAGPSYLRKARKKTQP